MHICNITYHRTSKMNPVDGNSSTYIDFVADDNDKDLIFKVGNHVTIFKYSNIKTFLQKVTLQIFAIAMI